MKMNFRNKDLIEVFEERYQANHNKKLQQAVKNNKKDTINRMFGVKTTPMNRPNTTNNHVIGYNNFKRK